MIKSKRRGQQKSQTSESNLSLKERLIKKRQAKEAQRKLITLIVICILIGSIIGLPLSLIVNLKVGLVITLLIPSLIVSYCYPRQALWFFLIYLPFSGTVTYWLGEGNALFQLSKDVFYIPALLALIQDCRQKRKPIIVNKKLRPTLFILIAFALMTLLFVNGSQQVLLPYCDNLNQYNQLLRASDGSLLINPATGGVITRACKEGMPFLQGLLGLKVFLGYIPLIFCAYYLIDNKKQLIFLGRLLVVLAIICCSLGVIQYSMLASGICNGTRGATGIDLFRASVEAKCFVGGSLLYSPSQGQIRLPGTFVSPWHWAWFLIANSFITFTVAFSDVSRLWRTAGLVGLSLVFINAVISGQRIALAIVPLAVLVLLILTGQIANLKRFIPVSIGLVLILTIVATSHPAIVQQRVDSFVGRWNNSPPHLFIKKQFDYAIREQKGVLGRGLGKATNSARAFGSTSLVETYHPKVLFETGYVGLIAFVVFVTHLTIVTFKSYRSVKTPDIRSFGASFWVFILVISYFPYWYPLDTDPVAVYYWLCAGVLLKLPAIDKEEQRLIRANLAKNSPKTRRKRVKARNARFT